VEAAGDRAVNTYLNKSYRLLMCEPFNGTGQRLPHEFRGVRRDMLDDVRNHDPELASLLEMLIDANASKDSNHKRRVAGVVRDHVQRRRRDRQAASKRADLEAMRCAVLKARGLPAEATDPRPFDDARRRNTEDMTRMARLRERLSLPDTDPNATPSHSDSETMRYLMARIGLPIDG